MNIKKIFGIGMALLFLLVIFSGLFSIAKEGLNEKDITNPLNAEAVAVDPANYDLGEVPMGNGLVTREYKVKNTTSQILKLKKIVTSCMCTKAKVKTISGESKLFGMEGHGDKNAPVNLEITPGEEALVTAIFDPAAHGPQGVGPIDRTVTLIFSDPAGIVELRFFGKVVG